MRRQSDSSSRVPGRPNAFSPEFLVQLLDSPEPLPATEADFSGPWKVEPMPQPGAGFAVLREWESLEREDVPEAVFAELETARIYAAVLYLVEREPLFHLQEEAVPGAAVPGGFPVTAVFGEEGTRVCGCLRRFHPEAVMALHLAEGLVRTPRSLAEVVLAAGGGALERSGDTWPSARRTELASPGRNRVGPHGCGPGGAVSSRIATAQP